MTIFTAQHRRFIYPLLLFVFTFLFAISAHAQSKAIKRIVEKGLHETNLFFYPSTLRMLNVGKDPDWYKLVSGVRHLRLLMFDKDSMLLAEKSALLAELSSEGYEEAMTFRDSDISALVLAYYEGDKMQGLAAIVVQESQSLLIELDGSVDPMRLYDIVQNGIDIPVLDSYFKDKRDEEERGKKYQEFHKSLEEEEMEKQDSLATRDTLNK